MEKKLTPGMRSYLKLRIIRGANKFPEFKKKLQPLLDEIAEERKQNKDLC
jgi:hypothetical protein